MPEESRSSPRKSWDQKSTTDVQFLQVGSRVRTAREINGTVFPLTRECLGKFGDALGREVWDAINSVFDVLPLAAVIDDQVSLGFDEILVKKMIA